MSAEHNSRIVQLAADRRVHRAFSWLHLHARELVTWQCELSSIAAPPFAEAARADAVATRFRDLGFREVEHDAAGSVLAPMLPLTGSHEPCLLLSAHLDTVFPAETDVRVRHDLPSGRLHGPGITDNAAGLVALLALAAALRHAELTATATILFAANTGEEGPGDLRGMRHLFGPSEWSSRIRAAIALEGAGDTTVVDRALGSRRLRLSVQGPGGHSWADAGRPNPVFALAEALQAIADVPLTPQPRTTLNAGILRGGTAVNSIPESASVELDLRSASAEELDRLEAAVLAAWRSTSAAQTRRDARLTHRVEVIGSRPAAELPENSPLLGIVRAVDRHLGLTTDFRIGSTDANLPLSLGVPALALGAGGTGGGIHTLGEWYSPNGRGLALRRLLLIVLATAEQVAASA